MCLLIYHLEPKLSSNAVQTILANIHMNVQFNIQIYKVVRQQIYGEVVSFTPALCAVHTGIQK